MFKIKDEVEHAIVYIYGTIGADFWDEASSNTAKDFSKTLDSLTPKPLDIHLDSCGGDVYEGFAIASAIQRYQGQTTVFVDGIAASAASYIAAMADKVVMSDFAQMMIHDAWTYVSGNSADLIAMSERLDSLDSMIATIIATRCGKQIAEVKAAMDTETWFTADEAVSFGLADEVIETEQRVAASLDRSILDRYKHTPNALLEPVEVPAEAQGKSHTVDTMQPSEGAKLLVLGNRVYTKE